jgi:hypothetical protein
MGQSMGAAGAGRVADRAASVTYETVHRAGEMAALTAVPLGRYD